MPLHKGQNVHFAYEAIPKLDYFLYHEVLHSSRTCISVAIKVREERVDVALAQFLIS